MTGVQIKINGEWLKLPTDFSISMEQQNPLFNEQGVFSFPFEIPIEANRCIFKNVDNPFSRIDLQEIDKSPAEVWFDGIMLYRGLIEVDDEIEIEDVIPVTFLSSESDFMEMIDGMNAQDVPLDRQIKLGYALVNANYFINEPSLPQMYLRFHLPPDRFMVYSGVNVSSPYPIMPYCNTRIIANCESIDTEILKNVDKAIVMAAERPYSGVCFYVRYFIDCLFKHLKIAITRDDLGSVEDMNRLAFFSTRCEHYLSDETKSISYNEDPALDRLFNIRNKSKEHLSFEGMGYKCSNRLNHFQYQFSFTKDKRPYSYTIYPSICTYEYRDVYATQKNFPNCDVKSIIDNLKTSFGVRFLFNKGMTSVKIFYIKDILNNTANETLQSTVIDAIVVKSKPKKVVLTYDVSDDTAFNYDDYSHIEEFDNYLGILRDGVTPYDVNRKIDTMTGNHYKVKVNKDTGGDQALFEVAGFKDFEVGIGKEERHTIDFAPVIVNDINGKKVIAAAKKGVQEQQCFAVYVNETVKANMNPGKKYTIAPELGGFWDIDILKNKRTTDRYMVLVGDDLYDLETEDQSPLRTYDPGLVLGIMRGPGNEAGIEYEPNYDGEGNSSWVQTVVNYAFTADSCDNFGRFFDYNGTEAGGADQSGRFSLKLVAGKEGYPIDSQYADRGLVSKFLSEYLYFMANKKTIVLTVKMDVTQIINIDFLKRYKIGGFLGFINKLSYTIGKDSIGDVTIELYTLN